jgi:hypothetical protein
VVEGGFGGGVFPGGEESGFAHGGMVGVGGVGGKQ